MKVALSMPFKNNHEMLEAMLPKIPTDMFNDLIFLDTGSTDGSVELIKKVIPTARFYDGRTPYFDHGYWRQTMLDLALKNDNEWLIMLDSDESIFRKDYEIAFKYMEKGKSGLYRMARINLMSSDTWVQELYPDWQARIMKTDVGFHYLHGTHAQPCFAGSEQIVRGHFLPNVKIYHYGWTRSKEEFTLKELNYKLWDQGKPGIDKLPDGQELFEPVYDSQPFLEDQP